MENTRTKLDERLSPHPPKADTPPVKELTPSTTPEVANEVHNMENTTPVPSNDGRDGGNIPETQVEKTTENPADPTEPEGADQNGTTANSVESAVMDITEDISLPAFGLGNVVDKNQEICDNSSGIKTPEGKTNNQASFHFGSGNRLRRTPPGSNQNIEFNTENQTAQKTKAVNQEKTKAKAKGSQEKKKPGRPRSLERTKDDSKNKGSRSNSLEKAKEEFSMISDEIQKREQKRKATTSPSSLMTKIPGVEDLFKELVDMIMALRSLSLEHPTTNSKIKSAVKDLWEIIPNIELIEDKLARHDSSKVLKLGTGAQQKSEPRKSVCERCKEEITEEEREKEIIQKKKVEFSNNLQLAQNGQDEAMKRLLIEEWPNECYTKVELVEGNPILDKNDNELLVSMLNPSDRGSILEKACKKYPELETIISEDLDEEQLQYVEYSTGSRKGTTKTKRVYITATTDACKVLHQLLELRDEMGKKQKLDIACVSTYEDRRQLRTLLELAFGTSNINVKLFKPKNKQSVTNEKKDNQGKYESIIVKIGNSTSYAEMVKSVKEGVGPDLATKVRSIKKTRNEDLLIITEKGGAEELRNEISSKISGTEVSLGGKRKTVNILGMEITTEEDEIKNDIIKLFPSCTKNLIEVKSLRPTSGGFKIATVSMTANLADLLISRGKIKIGWNADCRVRERKNIPQCTNCLKLGHITRNCDLPKEDDKKCMNCSETGHVRKDCKMESFCTMCIEKGHRSDSTKCPQFRKLLADENINKKQTRTPRRQTKNKNKRNLKETSEQTNESQPIASENMETEGSNPEDTLNMPT